MAKMARIALIGAGMVATAGAADAATYVTPAGGGQAYSNMQPSLAMAQYVQRQGMWPSWGDGGQHFSNADLVGTIRTFAYFQPGRHAADLAGGQTLNIAQNPMLFALIGTQYGGNGRDTFALPDLVGRTAIGAGSGFGLPPVSIGQVTGSNDATLTAANLPAHSHSLGDGTSTGIAGGFPTAVNNQQASLGINYAIAANGNFQSSDYDAPATGQIIAFAQSDMRMPNGYLAANGQLVQIADYQQLYGVIGTTYGGDGVTMFRLPDLTGRTAVGATSGAEAGRTQIGLGQTIGSATTTLTEANLPPHVHGASGSMTGAAGSGQAFSNEQPSTGVNYIINLAGIYPSFESPAGSGYLGEVSIFAGAVAPRNWMFAHGQTLNVNQNQALFSLLGYTYGGSGNVFRLPDLRGRTIVGAGTRAGVDYAVGSTWGSSQVQLTAANMPAHTHTLPEQVAAVPEPATWAMMIGGFGLVGGAMRRRTKASHVTA